MHAAEETARRISEETAALAREARLAGLDTLGYLLDMARIEANSHLPQSEADDAD